MVKKSVKCPHCNGEVEIYRNPFLTVDLILMDREATGVYLVNRRNEPHGWALPGGFVDYGEDPKDAAVREGVEETSLEIELLDQFGTYGDPDRDPRFHTVTIVYTAHGGGNAVGKDDALEAKFFPWDDLPEPIVFDHGKILKDYRKSVSQPG